MAVVRFRKHLALIDAPLLLYCLPSSGVFGSFDVRTFKDPGSKLRLIWFMNRTVYFL
jgi:hypothetical protein